MKIKFFALFCATALALNAQTYSISPAKTVSFVAAYNNITINDIYQVNTGNSPLVLIWERVSVNLPNAWDFSMCDFSTCHPGIPQGPTTMNTVPVGGQGFLGLNIDPANVTGSGVVKVRVYQQGFQNNADTLTWYISTPPTGVSESFADAYSFQVFPNPASDKINFRLPQGKAGRIMIKDLSGRAVAERSVYSEENILDISNFDKGIYFLQFSSGEKIFTTRFAKQ